MMNKKILRLAIPNIVSNLSIPLLSSVDTIVVGHLDNVAYLGAIAIGSMIFNFIYMGLGFLRMGTTGLSAQAVGSKNDQETILVLGRAISVALAAAVLLLLSQYLIAAISFELVKGTHEVEFFAREYFFIRIWAAPATLSLYAFHGWFLGVQNAKYPLILSLFVNIANIIFNLTFIYQFGMKSDGAALGTVIAQYLGLFLAVFLFLKKYRRFLVHLVLKKVIEFQPLKKFFQINFDILIRTLALIFAFSFFTAKSAEYGEHILAANTILINLWMIIAYGVDGFAFAAESLVGKFIGAKENLKLKLVIRYLFYWGFGMASVLSLFYWVGSNKIVALFTDNKTVINLALKYYTWTIFAPLINSFCFIWDGIYIGATETKPMRNSLLFSTIIIFLPAFYLTKGIIGNDSLWLAMTLFMAARGVTLFVYSKKYIYG
jgi:MATE family multidrug resistance protein